MERILQLGDLESTLADQDALRSQAREIVANMRGAWPLNQQALETLIKGLPSLSEQDLSSLGYHDGQCPICFVPFLSLLAEEEMAQAMDSPAHPLEELGVTRLSDTCGHIFCRKDISKWISTNHDTCPTCRTPLVTSKDARPVETIPDSEISDSLFLIEQFIMGRLDQLRESRELAQQEVSDDPDDGDENAQHPPTPRSDSPSVPPTPPSAPSDAQPSGITDEYLGMYS